MRTVDQSLAIEIVSRLRELGGPLNAAAEAMDKIEDPRARKSLLTSQRRNHRRDLREEERVGPMPGNTPNAGVQFNAGTTRKKTFHRKASAIKSTSRLARTAVSVISVTRIPVVQPPTNANRSRSRPSAPAISSIKARFGSAGFNRLACLKFWLRVAVLARHRRARRRTARETRRARGPFVRREVRLDKADEK
jgi:hypothetical protein